MATITRDTRTAVLDEAHVGDIRGALGTIARPTTWLRGRGFPPS
jgi:hypothetical protein